MINNPRSGANPSANIGLTAVNGTANTFLRSDGAPALSQSIAPTWTGLHQFANGKSDSIHTFIPSGTPEDNVDVAGISYLLVGGSVDGLIITGFANAVDGQDLYITAGNKPVTITVNSGVSPASNNIIGSSSDTNIVIGEFQTAYLKYESGNGWLIFGRRWVNGIPGPVGGEIATWTIGAGIGSITYGPLMTDVLNRGQTTYRLSAILAASDELTEIAIGGTEGQYTAGCTITRISYIADTPIPSAANTDLFFNVNAYSDTGRFITAVCAGNPPTGVHAGDFPAFARADITIDDPDLSGNDEAVLSLSITKTGSVDLPPGTFIIEWVEIPWF